MGAGSQGTSDGSGRHSVKRIPTLRTSGNRQKPLLLLAELRRCDLSITHLHLDVMDPQIERIICLAKLSFDTALDIALLGAIR